jgi:hypothetical protein
MFTITVADDRNKHETYRVIRTADSEEFAWRQFDLQMQDEKALWDCAHDCVILKDPQGKWMRCLYRAGIDGLRWTHGNIVG